MPPDQSLVNFAPVLRRYESAHQIPIAENRPRREEWHQNHRQPAWPDAYSRYRVIPEYSDPVDSDATDIRAADWKCPPWLPAVNHQRFQSDWKQTHRTDHAVH